MPRPKQSPYWFVIPRSGIDIADQQAYWNTRCFALKDSRQNLDRVRFSSLTGVTRLPGTPSIKIPLNLRLVEHQSRWTPVDNAPECWTLALSKSRYSKQLSECVAGHAISSGSRQGNAGLPLIFSFAVLIRNFALLFTLKKNHLSHPFIRVNLSR